MNTDFVIEWIDENGKPWYWWGAGLWTGVLAEAKVYATRFAVQGAVRQIGRAGAGYLTKEDIRERG